MNVVIDITQHSSMPVIGTAIGFHDFAGSLYAVGYTAQTPTYVGMTSALCIKAVPDTPAANVGPSCGMSEDGVLRLVAIIANNGQGTIKDILK